jgi:hypothetical protein
MFLRDWARHHMVEASLALFCVWLSLSLIAHLWLTYPKDSVLKKVFWSVLVCFPFLGWVFYGAFYRPLESNSIRAERSSVNYP